MARKIIIGCLMLGLLVFAQSAVGAQYDYELAYGYSGQDSGHRSAVDMDDWLERGRAAVTESPVFTDGIRLTAWGGAEAYEPGLASAIYDFPVPRWAQYLKITIRYRDEAQDDTIAGRLWIKSADRDKYEALDADEEAPLYGDTFVLRSERSSETITVPAGRHVEGNRVEMHIVAEGKDCIDVRDIRVEYLDSRPQITVVHRTPADYWHWWPRHRYAYHYYYWGPLFWPRTVVVYECWDVPSPFYWIAWRPWFFVNIIRVHHHHPWWGPRRYTVVYHVDVKQPLIKRRPLLRTRLKERQVHVTRIIRPNPAIRKTVPSPVRTSPTRQQEVRLNKEAQTPRTFEAMASENPTQRHVKKQPVQADKGRERPRVDTQTKTVKRPQAVNRPDPRSAHPSTTPQRIQDQPQPRTAQQQSRPRSRAQEKTVQPPIRKQSNKPGTEATSAPTRKPNTGQLAQEKKEPERLAENKQPKTVKRPQAINKPEARPTRPSHTASQRIQKEPTQPRTAQQQSRPRSMARGEDVRGSTRVHAAQDHGSRQEGAVQSKTKVGQGNRPQSRQEMRQPRPDAGQRRHR
jgi:hypothetical protein